MPSSKLMKAIIAALFALTAEKNGPHAETSLFHPLIDMEEYLRGFDNNSLYLIRYRDISSENRCENSRWQTARARSNCFLEYRKSMPLYSILEKIGKFRDPALSKLPRGWYEGRLKATSSLAVSLNVYKRCLPIAMHLGRGDYIDHVIKKYDRGVKEFLHAEPDFSLRDLASLPIIIPNVKNWRTADEGGAAALKEEWNIYCLESEREELGYTQESNSFTAKFDWFGSGTVRIFGDFETGMLDSFLEFVGNREVRTIMIGSSGGNIEEAMKLGRYIRENNIETYLDGNCTSACAFAFFGGVSRMRGFNGKPTLGFHPIHAQFNGVYVRLPNEAQQYVDIGNYVEEMGVDKYFVLRSMKLGSLHEYEFPTDDALCAASAYTRVNGRNCDRRSLFFRRFFDWSMSKD